jgi:hypothetical protein
VRFSDLVKMLVDADIEELRAQAVAGAG